MAQRYQREIEEILDQVNEDAPSGAPTKAPQRRRTQGAPSAGRRQRPRVRFSSGRLMVIGLVLIVSSLLLLGLLPMLAAPAAWLGIGLLITGYVVYFTKPRRTVERRWRGEIIEDEPEPSGVSRLWRWLTRG